MTEDLVQRVAALPCWSGRVDPKPLSGGLTNTNFLVDDGARRYVVRTGDDIPVHRIMRFNERNAARAAERVGLSPALHWWGEGVLVMDFIEGRTLSEEDVRDPDNLARVVELVKRCHRDMVRELRGPALAFWPFHAVYDYAHTLREGNSRMVPRLPEFIRQAGELEQAVGRGEMVFCHNDLLAANFIDDGERMWLIDWDYAGFGSPLFDLGGIASNNQLASADEDWLLEAYFEGKVPERLQHRFLAMKAVSLLRESMWSMVSELYSTLDVDYIAYTAENLERFDRAWEDFRCANA